jgi:hypothetical protein
MADLPASPFSGSVKSDPIVNPETLEFRRAITSDEQANSVYRRLIQDNKERTDKAAAIMRKYNDEQPWRPEKLKAASQAWRRNASTGFLSSLVKRIIPPYKQLIDTARTLTNSTLREKTPETEQKNDHFQVGITKTLRKWYGWNAFTYQLILENVLFGYSGGAYTDEYTWQPVFLRQDEAFFPDGCPQEASRCPLWAHNQNFLIHEMAKYLVDPEASKSAGWNIENVVDAINSAQPENRTKGTPENERKFEDVVRESSLGTSYSQGVKVIEAAHLFVQEASGKVSHYIINRRDNNGKILFKRLDRFDSMTQCLNLMSIEIGNGKLHGSKGAGRSLYNIAVGVEQARNLAQDNMYLAGMLLLVEKEGAKPQQALTVAHPVAVVGKGYEVSKWNFDANPEAFFQLDRAMTQLAELQVGAFMPGQLLQNSAQGERPTASEVNYTASIEQQIREGVLARFYGQFQQIVWECQKRICSPDNIAEAYRIFQIEQQGVIQRVTKRFVQFLKRLGLPVPQRVEIINEQALNAEAVECILEFLRKGLTPEEVFELSNCPSQQLTDELQEQNAAAIQAIVAKYTGNPNIDQKELRKLDISSVLGHDIYDRLEIDEEDDTVEAEAARMQLLELTSMSFGEKVPISPRDMDVIHMGVLKEKASGLLMNPQGLTPDALPVALNIFEHYKAHFESAVMKQGGKADGLEEDEAIIKQIEPLLAQAQMAAPPAPSPGTVPAASVTLPPGAASPIEPLPDGALPDSGVQAVQQLPLSRGPVPLI